MSFSVSFVFKANDKYSQILKKMAKSTDGLTRAVKKLNKEAKMNATTMSRLKTSLTGSGKLYSRGASNVGKYTTSLKKLTGATKSQIAQMQKMNRLAAQGMGGIGPGGVPIVPGGGGSGGKNAQKKSKFGSAQFALASMGLGIAGHKILDPIGYSVKKAIEYQAAFTDVAKVLPDNVSPETTNALQAALEKQAGDYIYSAPQVMESAAQIARAGIGKGLNGQELIDELTAFNELTLKAGTALEIPMDKMMEYTTQLKNGFNLTKEELRDLLDQVNELDNRSGGTGGVMIENVRRISGVFKNANFRPEDAMVMAAMLQQTGTPNRMIDIVMKRTAELATKHPETISKRDAIGIMEVFGTGDDPNLTGKKRKRSAVEHLQNFGKDVNKDAIGAFLKLFQRVKDLDKIEKGKGIKALSLLFPKEYASGIMNMADNLDEFYRLLGIVNDKTQYANSLNKEFAKKMATLGAQVDVTKGKLDTMFKEIGQSVVPMLTDILKTIQPVIEAIGNFAKNNPKLVKFLVIFGAIVGVVLLVAAAFGALLFLLEPIAALFGVGLATALGYFAASIGGILGAGALGGLLYAFTDIESALKTIGIMILAGPFAPLVGMFLNSSRSAEEYKAKLEALSNFIKAGFSYAFEWAALQVAKLKQAWIELQPEIQKTVEWMKNIPWLKDVANAIDGFNKKGMGWLEKGTNFLNQGAGDMRKERLEIEKNIKVLMEKETQKIEVANDIKPIPPVPINVNIDASQAIQQIKAQAELSASSEARANGKNVSSNTGVASSRSYIGAAPFALAH